MTLPSTELIVYVARSDPELRLVPRRYSGGGGAQAAQPQPHVVLVVASFRQFL